MIDCHHLVDVFSRLDKIFGLSACVRKTLFHDDVLTALESPLSILVMHITDSNNDKLSFRVGKECVNIVIVTRGWEVHGAVLPGGGIRTRRRALEDSMDLYLWQREKERQVEVFSRVAIS
jgi:hypothetical protein